MPNNQVPLLSMACICEKVLNENGVLSAIRIIDTVTVTPVPLAPGQQGVTAITVLLGFKSGAINGQSQVVLRITPPAGEPRDMGPWPIPLEGGIQGANLVLTVVIPIGAYGLYWFDVLWTGDRVLTSIPLRLLQGE